MISCIAFDCIVATGHVRLVLLLNHHAQEVIKIGGLIESTDRGQIKESGDSNAVAGIYRFLLT